MLTPLACSPDQRRVAAAFAALVFVMFSGSGARVALPGLKERTRAVPPARTNLRRATEAGVRVTTGSAAEVGGHAAALWRLVAAAWVYGFPTLVVLPALRGLAHGATAHDGAPKRRRWATLGGHGRHGAG